MTRPTLLWIFVALQALVPTAMAALREADVALGRHVLLRVEPIDPRDPFRGQYVALRYSITRMQFAPSSGTVYVRLRRTGDVWTGESASSSRPPRGTYIRGRVRADGSIQYGIEQFYASETDARRYESALAAHRVYAEVALGHDGRATLRRLLIR